MAGVLAPCGKWNEFGVGAMCGVCVFGPGEVEWGGSGCCWRVVGAGGSRCGGGWAVREHESVRGDVGRGSGVWGTGGDRGDERGGEGGGGGGRAK